MKTQNALITDSQTLTGAKTHFGSPLRIYDDGYGPLWISRDSMGINGIVRASTFEDAYSICEDEFFQEASDTIEELRAEYNKHREHVKTVHPVGEDRRPARSEDYSDGGKLPRELANTVEWETVETPAEEGEEIWTENALFQEAYGFRPNGPSSAKRLNGEPLDTLNHGIYQKDLNGDYLDELTPELLASLEITLEIKNEEEAE